MQEMPLQNSMLAKNTAFMDGFTNNQNHSVDERRLYENLSPVPNEVVEKSPVFLNTEPLSVEPATSERTKRIKENLSSMANKVVDNSTTFQNTEPLSVEKATSERTKRIKENLSPVPNEVVEKSTIFRNTQTLSVEPATSERTKRIKENLSPVPNEVVEKSTIFRNTETLSEEPATSERTKRMDHHPIERSKLLHGKSTNRTGNKAKAPTHRRDSLKTREPPTAEEDSRTDHVMPKVENKPSSRMPIILSVQRTESYSSLSDILKNISRTSSGLFKRDSNTIHAQSMWDLSQQSTATSHDKTEVPVPRYSRTSFYTDPMTPALALMEKRNDKVKATLMPKERPRSYSHLTVDWRKPLFKKDGGTREKH
ncbi:uncharacterized protein LOC115779953 [Archocentrus centrarchus]|uniref:uncharacterized protein LOC115779953 n=1 Tax=Archocentrus centrarchus TaxID=63155 RepID=UPI0011E9DD1A|nr:uncharacterized protein LOC115779953 [Archocentrus centrarchus]